MKNVARGYLRACPAALAQALQILTQRRRILQASASSRLEHGRLSQSGGTPQARPQREGVGGPLPCGSSTPRATCLDGRCAATLTTGRCRGEAARMGREIAARRRSSINLCGDAMGRWGAQWCALLFPIMATVSNTMPTQPSSAALIHFVGHHHQHPFAFAYIFPI